MWLRLFTHYLLHHRLKALALTFVLAFIPFIGTVGILIAALVTLVKGAFEGALFAIAATLPYVISFYFSDHQQASFFLIMWAAVGVAVLSNILTWVFALMLHHKTSWSALLQFAALMGILFISVIHLVYPDVATWWGEQLQQMQQIAESLKPAVSTKAISTAALPEGPDVIGISKQYATGMVVGAILLNAMLQLVLARWWQAIVFFPGRLHRELHSLRLNPLAGVSFVAALVLFYMDNRVVLDMMPVLYLLFAAAGLSIVHYLFGLTRSSYTWFWILLFYVALVISIPVSIMLIAILALLDIWLDIRKRFKRS